MSGMGSIATVLTVNAAPAQRGFSVYKTELSGARQATEQFSRAAGGGRGGGAFAFLELSRAAEDAAVSFGTGGFAGALRGAGNNISQFALAFGPLAGAITGIGVAALSGLVGWFERTKTATDAAKKSLDEFREKLQETLKVGQEGVGFQQGLRGQQDPADVQKQIEDRARRLEQLGQNQQDLQGERGRAMNGLLNAPWKPQHEVFGFKLWGLGRVKDDQIPRERLGEIAKEEQKIREEREKIEREMAELRGKLNQEQDRKNNEELKRQMEEREQWQAHRDENKQLVQKQAKVAGEDGGLPGFGALRRGTAEAQSAILRASQNRGKGVDEKQLKKLEDIERALNEFVKRADIAVWAIP